MTAPATVTVLGVVLRLMADECYVGEVAQLRLDAIRYPDGRYSLSVIDGRPQPWSIGAEVLAYVRMRTLPEIEAEVDRQLRANEAARREAREALAAAREAPLVSAARDFGRCAVSNCAAVLGAPRDRDGFCATCATEIEQQDREAMQHG